MTPEQQILITQGEYAVTDTPGVRISTLLGSCVACCLWDPVAGVGGMNHLLLATSSGARGAQFDMRGVTDMETLINAIIKQGGDRMRLRAKVFGGAKMIESSSEIGDSNSRFVFGFLEREGIPCDGSDVGGSISRALRFWPADGGRVNLKRNTQPAPPPKPVVQEEAGNGMELF